MNKQQLATKIWESANKLRSKIDANEYKDYILGFIFYKYLSDKEVEFLKKNSFSSEDIKLVSEDDQETCRFIQQNIGYFIAYQDLFSTWIEMGSNFDVSNVRDALSSFTRLIDPSYKKVFDKIFDTLQTGLQKLGDSSGAQTKAISSLIQLIKDIPMDGKQDYDVLGFIYEYLIGMFAANAGKKAGEFYTPHEVSLFMSEIVANHLQNNKEIEIYDPTSGSGSLLINIGKSVARHIADKNKIKYYAQELKENTYNLTRMNLVMRGILPANIIARNGDTLEDDWPYFDDNDPVGTYTLLQVDAVVSNPPYSQKWDPTNKENNPRFADYGLAPKGKADYAFLLHDLYHVRPDGIMTIVLPHGVLFRGGKDAEGHYTGEAQIRQNLIEKNKIDAIIGLPPNIFFGTSIPTIIMVLKQKRKNTDILIVDASKGFIKDGKKNKLRASDIKRMVDTVIQRKECPKYSKLVTKKEIEENDYNLNIPRYVDSSEPSETWDIFSSMFGGIPPHEIDTLSNYWDAFPSLKDSLFAKNKDGYYEVCSSDVKKTIKEHPAVVNFKNNYKNSFATLGSFLESELIDKMEGLVIAKEENIISDNIFERLQNVPLIDKYDAYQLLDNEWTKIAIDLEVIQSEGFESTTKVDPNIISKKKDGKDIEVQDGWLGRVIPFDLVHETLLSTEANSIKAKESRVSEITSIYDEILDSLSEEERDNSVVNDENDGFVPAEVRKEAKRIRSEGIKDLDPESFEAKLIRLDDLMAEEKDLKSKIKKESTDLQIKTKETIENLTKEQVLDLLKKKWIDTIVKSIENLSDIVVDQLSGKVKVLSEKYAVTFSDVEKDIKATEKELEAMLGELTADEHDMRGIQELKALLKGEKNG